MTNLIMVVEDNIDILDNIALILELNNFNFITSNNGKEALIKLNKLLKNGTKPDIIISDIMMPEMDGITFFSEVSKNNSLNKIPFIFLTALASPEDIRFGKMLGVDDYITKPFEEEDFLATIFGKLSKLRKSVQITTKIDKAIEKIGQTNIKKTLSKEIIILISLWDEIKGPILHTSFPQKNEIPFDAIKIVIQLFQTTVSIYGFSNIGSAEGLLLDIKNIERTGYIYFDSIPDPSIRGNKRQFMLAVISGNINYVESLKIKKILLRLADDLKLDLNIDITSYYDQIEKIFQNPIIKIS